MLESVRAAHRASGTRDKTESWRLVSWSIAVSQRGIAVLPHLLVGDSGRIPTLVLVGGFIGTLTATGMIHGCNQLAEFGCPQSFMALAQLTSKASLLQMLRPHINTPLLFRTSAGDGTKMVEVNR